MNSTEGDKMDNDHLDIWVKISTQIGELSGLIKTALDKIADHEKRLDDLEKDKDKSTRNELKDELLKWLVRGLVASIFVIGSLTGASAMIKQVLGI